MLSVKDNQNTIIIKNSKFICLLYQVDDLKKVDHYLTKAKLEYKDATHYCYSYKLDGTEKFSDDKEPSGTAGLPMMEVLNKRGLNHILCIVIRYFGGIKLGAGGLVRAYSKAVRDALDKVETIELVEGYLIRITTSYEEQKKYDYLFKDKIIKKEFNDQVLYYIELEKEEINKLNIDYQILENRWIKKI